MSEPLVSWYRTAGVRSGVRRHFRDETDAGKVFFPDRLVPYLAHEALAETTPEQRRTLTIRHLYQFLLSTAHLETRVVNCAAELIANGRAGVELPVAARLNAFKIYCDEGYHSLYSLDLADQIARETGIPLPPWDYGRFVDQLQQTAAHLLPDAPALARLLPAVVFETLITAVLNEIPNDSTVLTVVRDLTRDHAKDEGHHHRKGDDPHVPVSRRARRAGRGGSFRRPPVAAVTQHSPSSDQQKEATSIGHYREYLHLDALLSLQRPRIPAGQARVWAAEHFFIVGHQCCELWLAQVLLDLDKATEALSAPDLASELALEHLSRAAHLFDVLHDQVMVLDQLPSRCFAQFRPYLGSASGAQSAQFRELDRRLGLIPPDSPVERAFLEAITASGLELADVCRANLDAGVLHRIADALLDIAQGYWRWKITHLSLVARLLGDIGGTAGTSGATYLAHRVRLPFPDLHQARRLADHTEPSGRQPRLQTP